MGHFYYAKRFVCRVKTNVRPLLKKILEKRHENQLANSSASQPESRLSESVPVCEDAGRPPELPGHDGQQPINGQADTDGGHGPGDVQATTLEPGSGGIKLGLTLGAAPAPAPKLAPKPVTVQPAKKRPGRPHGTTKKALAERKKNK